ncbi:MAG: hypothetical protein M3280_00630 [Actinomycetota bacterium]|nr:hypothetical protein [Actinomycetota bacterium]
MRKHLDHSECRELLRDYRRGDLEAVRTKQVSDHLQGCDECRRLHDQLVAFDSSESLTDIERTRLHAGVRRRLTEDGKPARWVGRRRLAGALGVAALLAVTAVGAATLLGGGGAFNLGSGDEGGAGFAQDQFRDAGRDGEQESGPAPVPTSASGRPKFPFERYEKLNYRDLERIGKGLHPTRAFETLGEDTAGTGDEQTNYGGEVPEIVRSQIGPCTRKVQSATDEKALPAYGAVGTLESRSALILAFLLGEPGPEPDRYTVWAWPTGSCDHPLARRTGALPP